MGGGIHVVNKSSGKLSLTLLQGCDIGSMNWVYALCMLLTQRDGPGALPSLGLAGFSALINKGRAARLYQGKPGTQGSS